jgi:hypothetical protein
MKVSNHLPRFNEPNLLVVAGKQEGCFYLSQGDTVKMIDRLKINKAQYTDREGRFDKRAGHLFSSGSVYEPQDDELTRSFIKQLAVQATDKANEHKVESIYLFCPTYMANLIEASLPHDLRTKIKYIFFGNYNHQHPFVLLSKIQEYLRLEHDRHTVEPISKEALNLLNKANHAA